MPIRDETVEEERDRYKKALETIRNTLEKEDLWIDKDTTLNSFIDMDLTCLAYLGKNREHIRTSLGKEERYGEER